MQPSPSHMCLNQNLHLINSFGCLGQRQLIFFERFEFNILF